MEWKVPLKHFRMDARGWGEAPPKHFGLGFGGVFKIAKEQELCG